MLIVQCSYVDEYFIARLRKEYEDLCVVCYINSTAEIKTMSDVCVTSSNAKRNRLKLYQIKIFYLFQIKI